MYRIKQVINALSRNISDVRCDAGWKTRGVFEIATAVLGVLADILTPWFNLLGWIFPFFLALTLCGYFLWRSSYRQSKVPKTNMRGRKISASATMYGIVGALVLAPIFFVNISFGGSSGALAGAIPKVESFQAYLGERFDRLERALAVLTESTDRQGEHLQAVQETMELSLAMELVDRAREMRDGSNQAQGKALETLVANGFSFSGTDFSGVSMMRTKLDGADFSNGRFHFSSFEGAHLRGANFAKSGLRFSNAKDADFSEANLSGMYAPFFEAPGANFTLARLSGSSFFGANFRGADLSGADLSGAAFPFADLRDADLRGADLSGAHFIGTLLQGAKLRGAVFKGTNMLAATLDPDELTRSQRTGACRHRVHGRGYIEVHLMEKWPSDRYDSGYDFKSITDYVSYARGIKVSGFQDTSLPICTTDKESAAAFNAQFPTDERMHLDREYLSKAGRHQAALDRLKVFARRMSEARQDATLLTGTGDEKTRWLKEISAAVKKVKPIAGPYINSEQLLLLFLAEGFVDEKSIDWFALAQNRLGFEKTIREKYEGVFDRYSRWGPLFPDGEVSLEELPHEKVADLYRQWTHSRMRNIGEGLIFQPASAFVTLEDRKEKTLSFNTGFLRRTAEGLTTSNSWPNWSTSYVEKIVGDLKRTKFAPVRVWGIDRVIFVFPESYQDYGLEIPYGLEEALPKANPDLEVDLQIQKIERVSGKEGIVLVHVVPQQARLYKDGKLVHEGALRVVEKPDEASILRRDLKQHGL